MKNYELILWLSKYPAGHEILFDAVVNPDNCIRKLDEENAGVVKKIECVDSNENYIVLR